MGNVPTIVRLTPWEVERVLTQGVSRGVSGRSVGFPREGLLGLLLAETFDDLNYGDRGWYDGGTAINSAVEQRTGAGCIEFEWETSATTPNGRIGRYLFTPTNQISLIYYTKFSDNFVGSEVAYHPHFFYFLTDFDTAYQGPYGAELEAQFEPWHNGSTGMVQRFNVGPDAFSGNPHPYPRTVDSAVVFTDAVGAKYKGDYHKVRLQMVMNTQVGTADGICQVWVDEALVIDLDDIEYRAKAGQNSMLFNQLILLPYIGDGSPVNQFAWIDDLTLYIGDEVQGIASGSMVSTATTQLDIVAGGGTLQLTTQNDTYVAAGATYNAQRQNIIDGVVGSLSTSTSWNDVVQAGLSVDDVVRTSDNLTTITLPAFVTYFIAEDEIVSAEIPADVLVLSTSPLVAGPSFTIEHATVVLSGTVFAGMSAEDIVAGAETVLADVTSDEFAPTLGDDNQISTDFLAALTGSLATGTSWNPQVRDNLTYDDLTLVSPTQARVDLPAAASYAITETETVGMEVPASSFVGSPSPITATPTFNIASEVDVLAGALFYTLFPNEETQAGTGCGSGFSSNGLLNWGGWSASGTGSGCDLITASAAYSGGLCTGGFRHKIADGGSGNNGGGCKWEPSSAQPELWIRCYIRYTSGCAWSSLHYDKLFYLYTGGSTQAIPELWEPDGILISAQSTSNQNKCLSAYGWNSMMGGAVSDGLFHCVEFHIKMDTNQTDGEGRIWVEGDLKAEYTDMDWSAGNSAARLGYTYMLIGSNREYLSNGGVIQDLDYSDLVIYNTTPPNVDGSGNPMIGTL